MGTLFRMKIFIINCVILRISRTLLRREGCQRYGLSHCDGKYFYNVCMECTGLLHALTCRIFLEYIVVRISPIGLQVKKIDIRYKI